MTHNPHISSSLDELLEEDGILLYLYFYLQS